MDLRGLILEYLYKNGNGLHVNMVEYLREAYPNDPQTLGKTIFNLEHEGQIESKLNYTKEYTLLLDQVHKKKTIHDIDYVWLRLTQSGRKEYFDFYAPKQVPIMENKIEAQNLTVIHGDNSGDIIQSGDFGIATKQTIIDSSKDTAQTATHPL